MKGKKIYESSITANNVVVSVVPMLPDDILERDNVTYVVRSRFLTLLKIKTTLKMLWIWRKHGKDTQIDVVINPVVQYG